MIEGHTVDMPVSNPFLTDKLIDEELKQMMDMQVSEKRRGSVLNNLSIALSVIAVSRKDVGIDILPDVLVHI